MTSTIGEGEGASTPVYKTDRLQRVRIPRERQEAILEEYERSGASGMQFAAYAGVKYPTFASWLARRKRERAAKNAAAKEAEPARALKWVEAVVEEEVAAGAAGRSIRLQLPGGAYLELSTPEQAKLAAQLLVNLQGRC